MLLIQVGLTLYLMIVVIKDSGSKSLLIEEKILSPAAQPCKYLLAGTFHSSSIEEHYEVL